MLQPQRSCVGNAGGTINILHDQFAVLVMLVLLVGYVLCLLLCIVGVRQIVLISLPVVPDERKEVFTMRRNDLFLELHNAILANRLFGNRWSGAAIKDLANA